MNVIKPTAAAVALAFAAPAVLGQGAAPSAAPADLAPVVVTANPLGSSLFDLVPPVSVLTGRELDHRRESTLGETVSRLPGVSSTWFGPNASRPVIRGLDADRIRILQNGTGMQDLSALSPDHASAADPLAVDRIEVVRGPAALLYGGSAVGGVVNVLDNRIPAEAIDGVTGRFDASAGGAAQDRSGALVVEGGNGRFALHADIHSRDSDDLRIPGYARSSRQRALDGPGSDQPRNRLPNSAGRGDGGALGASMTFDRGYLGLSAGSFNANYGTVAEPDVRIDMESRRWDLAGELRNPGSFVQAVKFKAGYTDYEHRELEGAEVATTFRNRGYEARVEATHGQWGPFSGAFGAQLAKADFSALGDEALLPKVESDSSALFVYEEAALGRTRFTLGGRLEEAKVASAGGLPRFGASRTRHFSAGSASAGALYSISPELNLAANLSHTERAPSYAELFSNGPHSATGQFVIGDSDLAKEKSNGVDVQLRWRSGKHSASIGAFANRFRNYIALLNTGNSRGGDGELNPADADGDGVADGSGEEIMPEAVYRQVRADFRGIETEGRFRVYEGKGSLDLNLRGDVLRATDRDSGDPLPRIAPWRLGAGLDYRLGDFGARLDVTHAGRQGRVAAHELATDSYTLVDVGLTYRIKVPAMNLEAYLKANNLFDREARVHSSFLKDIAPLPGRGILAGVRGSF